jgi:SAM-dependent methyltransferase
MSDAVHSFFSQWEIYRLCIEHNTLHHREVGEILRGELAGRSSPFRFLDLASGDSTLTARALQESAVQAYTAVDFSAPALLLGRENTRALGCGREFIEADFTSYLRRTGDTFDVVYLGLSLHHLQTEAKRAALQALRHRVAPGGVVFLFEPILLEGESREECLTRWRGQMDRGYAAFPAGAREAIWAHVSSADYPETVTNYLGAARAAGFARGEEVFTEPEQLYSLFRLTA